MIAFLLIASLMLAVALFFVLSGLRGQEQKTPLARGAHIGRDALNLDVLQDQLRELNADAQDGTIDAAGYRSARQDLERRVALEIHATPPPMQETPLKRWPVAGLGLAVTIVAGSLYVLLGTPNALAPRQIAAVRQVNAPPVSAQQIEGMVAGLAKKLKDNPNDVDGWRMLARSYETMRRFDLAVDAYRHLVRLTPDDPDLLADYAVTLAMSLNQDLSGEPEKLIHRALEIDPKNVQALALLGSAAFERKEYDQAIKPWKQILALVPGDSDMARSIAAGINKAEGLARSAAVQKSTGADN